MKEQAINEQYNVIRNLIVQKRLKEALVQLESYLWQCPDWNLHSRLEQVQTSYTYMLQYMQKGTPDPDRRRLHLQLLAQTIEIADQTRLYLLDESSSSYYHEFRRRKKEDNRAYSLSMQMHTLESFSDDLAISSLESDYKRMEVLKRHEESQKQLFLHTWANSAWSVQEEADAKAMLASELLPVNDLCLFTSAVMLSLLYCFDLRKMMWLMDAYTHPGVFVSQRALVGIVFALHTYSELLKLYPEVAQRIVLTNENIRIDEDIARVYKQILLCQETEKINKKMQEEIIPEMLKNAPTIRDMKLGIEDSDEEKDDRNPDWSSIENTKLGEQIREMGELQLEGADVYMSSFAALKTYPFFSDISNWFLPFDKQHSSVINALNEEHQGSILNIVLQSPMFCNSDKYSIAFTLMRIPQMQRDMMMGQLSEQQMDELNEQTKSSNLKSYSEQPENVSNQYLHDLYRFFKLSMRRQEFRDIFKEKIELYKVDTLKNILPYIELLEPIANFYLQKEHWVEASEVFAEITQIIKQEGIQRGENFQKLGYVLQKQKRYTEAIAAYLDADTLLPDNLWTNSHLATSYRMNHQYEKALEYYKRVEDASPENRSVLFFLGNCLAQLQRYEEALKYFFKLDYMEENSLKAWRGIAWCSFVCNKHEQAMRYYEKIIAYKPVQMDFLNAGHVAWTSGEIEKAMTFYTKAKNLSATKDEFIELFNKDRKYLLEQSIMEEDIPLMLDLV